MSSCDLTNASSGRLDFLHATERLWELAHVFDEPVKHRMKMDGHVFMLLNGQVWELTAWFRHQAKTRPLSPADRKKVEAECGYFENNWERMRYDEYPESRQLQLVALGQGGADDVQQGIQSFGDIGFGLAGLVGDGGNPFGFIHRGDRT